MTDKKLLSLMTLIFLQTACTQTPVRQTVIKKAPQTQTRIAKPAHTEPVIYKNEPITVEEIPISKPAVSALDSNKTRPALPAAVQSLIANAEKSTKAGDLDSASVMLERALRISPRNAELTYQLASLRLKQSQPRLAEDLGKKAEFLAATDKALKKRCWQLIAQARELQGNVQGAKEAQLKADNLQ